MNHEQYVQRMAEIGYSREDAEDLIWFPKDSSETSLALRTFNFVPIGDGLYEIWISGDRDDFFRVRSSGRDFVGSLSEAYEYVYEDRRDA